VVLSRARKDEAGTPTVPSRWLARLEAVLAAADSGHRVTPREPWAAWALALDEPAGPPRPCRRPRPCPPPAARPRELWATDVELLMRDPYSVYARRILGLRPLDPVDADPGLPERGQIIHRCLEAFVTHPECATCEDPHALLLGIGRGHFARHAESPQVRALWWPRFEAVARWFVDLHKSRAGEIATVRAELEGALEVDVPTGRFRLRGPRRPGRAAARRRGLDRGLQDRHRAQPDEVRFGLKPQLLVEAMIAAEGGFKGLPAGDPTEILYWG
jgi:ATP-dependent helicase/nuclease subunit B